MLKFDGKDILSSFCRPLYLFCIYSYDPGMGDPNAKTE